MPTRTWSTPTTTSRSIPPDDSSTRSERDCFARPPLTAAATRAAFPLGGIGTGNVSIGARGELRDWEIRNAPSKGTSLPCTFFSIHTRDAHGRRVSRVLEAQLQPPFESEHGFRPGTVAGLPRLRGATMRGEYPFARIAFDDDVLPVRVELEAFTPLIPLDCDDSALPAAVLRYRIANPGDRAVDVTVAGCLFNPVGWRRGPGSDPIAPAFDGVPHNEFRGEEGRHGLLLTSSLPSTSPAHGSLALLTSASQVSADPSWTTAPEACGLPSVWRRLACGTALEPSTDLARDEAALLAMAGPRLKLADRFRDRALDAARHRAGTLAASVSVAAHDEQVVEFVLCWHFPNRARAWLGPVLENTNADETVRNHYATRFADAWAVGEYVLDNLPRLEQDSRSFHGLLYGSNLPAELVDALGASLATLRSTTCFRLADGTFAAWEGSDDHAGSCEGTCTHVWNYAQTVAFLFPELERSARRMEFRHETDADGRMNFRGNAVFGGRPWRFPPAVDGQLGTIVRLYREWRHCGDDAFLADLWPGAVRALDFVHRHWDRDHDLVLEHEQHNTYDVEFVGANPLSAALFCAALRAAAAMAEHLGDTQRAQRYVADAEVAATRTDELLWNGEYYAQSAAHSHEPNQVGDGCLADQVFGQLLAHVVGLGHVLPAARVRSALAAVYRHNYRRDLGEQTNFGRTYALAGEGGLVLCSWPRGGRPAKPFGYCDEVWTGVEYQVASHLVYEGMVSAGLDVVRAVRERHDGVRRSPWNEIEAGNHYARALASWAVLTAYSGFAWDAPRAQLGFLPPAAVRERGLECFFSTATAWGRVVLDATSARVEIHYGTLELRSLVLPCGTGGAAPRLRRDTQLLTATWHDENDRRVWSLPNTTIGVGDVLTVEAKDVT